LEISNCLRQVQVHIWECSGLKNSLNTFAAAYTAGVTPWWTVLNPLRHYLFTQLLKRQRSPVHQQLAHVFTANFLIDY
jgi:hypothetical protein